MQPARSKHAHFSWSHLSWFRDLLSCTFLLGVFVVPALGAPEPVISSLDIRGMRIGGNTSLTLDGDQFGKAPRLLLPFAAKQTLKPGSTDKKAVFDVTLGNEVAPGYYHLRLVTEGGVSLPVIIGVDRLLQQPVATPVTELPVAVHGAIAGSAAAEIKFQGKAKQKMMIEVEAQRFGSKLRPVLHLYSAKKLQLAWSWGMPTLLGDTRLDVVLAEEGTYTVALHDAEYAAGAPSFFRLRLGSWSFIDQVYPPVVAKNQPVKVELLGPGPSITMDVAAPKGPELAPLSWPKDGNWSGPRPFISYSPFAELLQQPKKDQIQDLPAGLVGVSGRLATPYGEDRYKVPVTPGKKIRLEVFAERLGSSIDAALVVRDDKGAQLARGEDSPGTLDPVLEYSVPDKVTSIVVGVVDAQGRGGPRGIYRLVVDPKIPMKGVTAFTLNTTLPRLSLPVGGRAVVPILVDRQSYQGKIDLSCSLPPSVKLSGTTIPEGADGTLLTLERSESALDALVTSWRGQASDGTQQVAVVKGNPLEDLQPWLATEFAVAASDAKATEIAIDWRNLPPDARLMPGSKLPLPVKVTRDNSDKTTVKLTLITSQIVPLANNAPDPNKTLRQEKPIELPAKVSDGDLVALVPPTLSGPVYDVTVQAELLGANKKVLATAYAPVRRLALHIPIAVKLTGPNRIESALDAKKGTVFKIQGKIERDKDLKAEVTLALAGLPGGIKPDAATVKADATDFTLTVTLPPSIMPSELKGLKLTGSYAPDAKQPNIRVNTREIEVTLVVQAPAK